MSRVNLLPWRQQRQTRCIRLWGLLLVGWLLMVLTVTFWLRAHHFIGIRALQQDIAGLSAVQHALEARQKLVLQIPQAAVQPSANQPWQPVLLSLAQEIPSQAWLTQLRYQPPSLTLTGYAASLSALTAMADALTRVKGMSPGAAGELQQDNQGRWMFTFRLVSQG
ncbi:TPA: PilN domain-containing protein [Enterobacter asburiae]|uniref:PilN domain-containing protein n=1 Tax=Enterobacter sp. C4G1 TaxID=3458724 RepID=UPI0032F0BB60|nr:PilN domain-containing protein [Enterobacter asburiae]HDR2805456.1 PilN domain-containing protein [Enterobacter asburiae]HDR2810975.1 PilN domain-containing protein [Enterobacter asburiae]HDR2816352.1 PilN domain-containing protein [Enterobacter asburiae]